MKVKHGKKNVQARGQSISQSTPQSRELSSQNLLFMENAGGCSSYPVVEVP